MAKHSAAPAGSSAGPALLRIALLGGAVLGCLLALHSASRVIEAIPVIQFETLSSNDHQRARDAAFVRTDSAKEGWLQLRVLLNVAPALLPGPKATIDRSADPAATQPTLSAGRAKQFETAFANLSGGQQQTRAIGPLRLIQAALILSQLETIEKPRPWWPYIKPNLTGLDPASLRFEIDALRQSLADAYVSLGLGPGAAAEFAESFVGGSAATFASFIGSRLTTVGIECESAGDAECAEACRRILFTMLRHMVVEDRLPAIRLVAADQLAAALESELGRAVPDRAGLIAGLRAWRSAYHESVRDATAGPLSLNPNSPNPAPAEQAAATRAISTTLWLAIVTAALAVGAFLVTLLGIFSRIASVLAKAGDPGAAPGLWKRSFVVALAGVLLIAGLGFARAPADATRADDIRQLINWKTRKSPPKARGHEHWLSHYRVSFVEPAITAAVVGVLAMRFGWLGRRVGRQAMAGTAASLCIAVMLCGISTLACSAFATRQIAAADDAVARALADPTMGLGAADAELAPLRAWTP